MKQRGVAILKKSFVFSTTILALTASMFAAQFTVLHSFQGNPAQAPAAALVAGPGGNYYGTTAIQNSSCPKDCGTIFEYAHTSNGWHFNVIHNFRGPKVDGELPFGPMIFDKAGNLYGTTFSEGSSNCITQHADCGTVFELSPTSKGGWVETVLYRFTGSADGAYAEGNLAMDANGNLYGTTLGGGLFNGSYCNTFGCGVIYELSPGSNGWTETVLYTFTGGSDGWRPDGVRFDANGNLLGVTDHGGSSDAGTVFKLSPSGNSWALSTLYTFTGGSDGAYPNYNLLLDQSGNIYGTALGGGLIKCGGYGCGTIFELSPSGNTWKFSDLYSFSGPDGEEPHGILFDPSGNIFGVAYGGVQGCPSAGCGVLFELTPGSGNWAETVIHKFNGTSDGEFPNPVLMDSSGNLFGTAVGGGTKNVGTLFEYAP